MKNAILRRLATIGAVLALALASSPQLGATPQASAPAVTIASTHMSAQAAVGTANRASQTGQGWGTMIACAGCLAGAAAVVAGGPAAIIIAANMPGSAIAAIACTAVCYEAFR